MDKNKDMNPRNNSSADDTELPGYPHYAPEEDIMNPQHGFKKVSADEELANSARLSSNTINKRPEAPEARGEEEMDDLGIVPGTEADVTEDDLIILGDKDEDQDLGDDELTSNARVDALEEEDELDIPGADDKESDSLDQEDEENDYYSLGGDRHENLDEESPNTND